MKVIRMQLRSYTAVYLVSTVCSTVRYSRFLSVSGCGSQSIAARYIVPMVVPVVFFVVPTLGRLVVVSA